MSEEIKKTKKKNNSNTKTKKAQTKKEKVVTNNKKTKNKTNSKSTTKVKKEIKKEKKIFEEEKVLVEEKENPRKKKSHILLIVLGCVILFLILACVIVRKWYLPTEKHTFDYFSLRTVDYVLDSKKENKLVSEDGKCIITVTSQMLSDIDINELGTIEKIKDQEWAKQEFANGYTWLSHHENMLYIVQMYALDNDTFNDYCKKDFNKIKKTFSFIKDE